MRVINFDPALDHLGPAVIAIGVFDGVHIGHQALVSDTVADAVQRDCRSVIITFDRDPDQVISPDSALPQLLTLEEKCAFLGDAGAQCVLVVPFDTSIASLSPAHFIDSIVRSVVAPVAVHVGLDFRFGHFAEGDIATLRALGDERGFVVVGHSLVSVGDAPVTSTRIRSLVAVGDTVGAAALLGRPHRVSGRVVHGRGVGDSLLGVPTANITPSHFAALPAEGVYAGRVITDCREYLAGISVGVPPTFPEALDYFEAHLIGFKGDLYGATLVVEFGQRLRDQLPFDSTDELASRIEEDLATIVSLYDYPEVME